APASAGTGGLIQVVPSIIGEAEREAIGTRQGIAEVIGHLGLSGPEHQQPAQDEDQGRDHLPPSHAPTLLRPAAQGNRDGASILSGAGLELPGASRATRMMAPGHRRSPAPASGPAPRPRPRRT